MNSDLRYAFRQVAKSPSYTNGLDPDLPIYNLITLDEHMASSPFALMPVRMDATLAGMQGCLGLLLAVLGLNGRANHPNVFLYTNDAFTL